jgi:hypothetical protein
MSTIKADTLSNLAGTQTVPVSTVAQGSAKAWVNFDGTGTVAIRAAFNVSSITDNGTGDYTVNFTNAMVDANYGFNVQNEYQLSTLNSQAISVPFDPQTASAFRFLVLASYGSGASHDVARIAASFFR